MTSESYIARQPIVDAKHQLYAYELLFRQSRHSVSADIHNALQAGVEVINNALCLGTDWLLQGKFAFINLDEATMMSDYITLLPTEHVVFEILETVKVTPVLIARVQELRQLGYRFALDDFVCLPEYQPLMPLVDFIKLDVLEQHPDKTMEIIRHVRSLFGGKLLAEKVENREMFELCRSAGVAYFQGYYFARPENIANKSIRPGQLTVLELMNKARVCEDLGEIEETLKRDAALTFKLLRYVNCASSGLSRQVVSVRQALSVIGLKPLYRWLALLLVTANAEPTTNVLARTAVIRGRICELLGAGNQLGKTGQDDLFIVGMFSLLDALMDMPMDCILERVPLSAEIAEALLRRGGPYGPYLALAEACERHDFGHIEACTEALGLRPEQVNAVQLKALAWVEGLDLN